MAGTQRVLYNDKETFQTSPLDEINKATAGNYNELKSVINVNAQALDDIFSLTTGDISAIQNTFTSDISAQTGTKTFTGLDWDITTTGRTSTGDITFLDFKKDAVSKFKVDVDGQIISSSNTNVTTILGRALIDSRTSDNAHFSHIDRAGNDFALRQLAGGLTTLNAGTGQEIHLAINTSAQWTIATNGNMIGSSGNTLTVDSKLFANDRLALGLTTGDVATPLEGEIWYNNTSNKFRAFQNATAVDMIGGGGGDVTKVGTPVNNQLGVWTGDGTIEGVDINWDNQFLIIGDGTFASAHALGIRGKISINTEDQILGTLFATWGSSSSVASIRFLSGDDTANKDNATITFNTSSFNETPLERMRIGDTGNIGINGSDFGSGDKVIFVGNASTNATVAPTDGIILHSKDSSDGSANATLAMFTEQSVEAIGTFTPSHKIKVWWNNAEYWLQLDAV